MNSQKIIPSLWFAAEDGKLASVIEYYQQIFGEAFEVGNIIPLGDTPSGYAEMGEVKIFEQKYSLMSTAQAHHPLNDALSFILHCKDQDEIDRYWNYFTKEGEASQCGWCQDKFGLRWQILPENLAELMSTPNSFAVMMQQQKIVIAEYLPE